MPVKLATDHGWPKASTGDDGHALEAFRNERDYIAQGGKLSTTVAAMDWAHREIMRMGSTLITIMTIAKAGTSPMPAELNAICKRGLAGLETQIKTAE